MRPVCEELVATYPTTVIARTTTLTLLLQTVRLVFGEYLLGNLDSVGNSMQCGYGDGPIALYVSVDNADSS
jgi:hypothetical protein